MSGLGKVRGPRGLNKGWDAHGGRVESGRRKCSSGGGWRRRDGRGEESRDRYGLSMPWFQRGEWEDDDECQGEPEQEKSCGGADFGAGNGRGPDKRGGEQAGGETVDQRLKQAAGPENEGWVHDFLFCGLFSNFIPPARSGRLSSV